MRFWTLEEIKARLSESNIRAVAKRIGVHEQTLYSFMSSKSRSVNFETYRKLVEYLEGVA